MGQGLRRGALVIGLAATGCSSDGRSTPADPFAPQTLTFGPIELPAHSEDLSKCVALTLHNDQPLYVNSVTLTTGPGFHHSNWLWVPDHAFPGPDGIFNCDDRSYDQTAAGILGGVFFAQSTQSTHETQAFPAGVARKVPEGAKLVAQLHLLNTGDDAVTLEPTISLTPMAEDAVTTQLSSVTFEFHPLALPPQRQSRFSVECDIATRHQETLGRLPDFKIFYALAHYHEWGTKLSIDAVRADGTSSSIYSTASSIGDALGGVIDPPFDMTGFAKLRLTCEYFNNTASTIYYGNGGGEMCIFNAFSDSPYKWGGGALDNGSPGPGTDVGGVMTFARDCQVFSVDDQH